MKKTNKMNSQRLCQYLLIMMALCFAPFAWSVSTDTDGDGVINTRDNCREVANPQQIDSDNDGYGNVCDGDFDNNGRVDSADASLFVSAFSSQNLLYDLDESGRVGLEDFRYFNSVLLNNPPGPGAEQETTSQSLVNGRVTDTAGLAVFNATIEVYQDGQLVSDDQVTDIDGNFSLTLNALEKYSLRIASVGFAYQVVPVSTPKEDGRIFVDVTIIKRGEIITISNSGQSVQVGANGAAVTVDKDDFVDASGNPVTGDIQLTITPVDVSNPATLLAFPGSFTGVSDEGAEPNDIISLGTVEYEFTQNGQPIQLAADKTADIIIPMYVSTYQDGTTIKVGDTIPLWSLNEKTGVWLQEGTGQVIASSESTTGLAMQATVSHFTWWNCDIVAQTASVSITVLGSRAGEATILAQATTLAWLSNASTTLTVGDTTEPLKIPANTEVCFSAGIFYDDFSFAFTQEACITAATNEQLAITLNGPAAGPVDIISNPIGFDDDKLKIYALVDEPVPVNILPITAEQDISYTIASGILPDGLALNVFGNRARLVGTPTTTGTFEFTVEARDTENHTDTIEFIYVVEALSANQISLDFAATDKLGLSVGVSSGIATIDWQDGEPVDVVSFDTHNRSRNGELYTSVYHDYGSTRSGSVVITFLNGIGTARVLKSERIEGEYSTFDFDVAALSKAVNLKVVEFDYGSPLTGDFGSLPTSLEYLYINGRDSTVTGTAANLPRTLTYLRLQGKSGVSGKIQDLPVNLEHLSIYGRTSVASGLMGNIANLPGSLTYLYLYDKGNVNGDIEQLSSSLETLYLLSSNTVSGNIASITDTMRVFYVRGSNTLTGNIANIPQNVKYFDVHGNNTISGNVNTLSAGLASFNVYGQNTIMGDIGTLENSITNFNVRGNNTLLGDIASLKETMRNFTVYGNNTIMGNITTLPINISSFTLYGNNTVYGDLSQLVHNQITTFQLGGENTVDKFNLPSQWNPKQLANLNLQQGGSTAFDSFEVDNLLNHLNTINFSRKNIFINILRLNDGAPTAASATAVSELTDKGARVITK
ncbi:thrombospondin type 3 repeat-containing protein [Marinagarivorans algicola]|uniref:thrombospondin type 3 repeat-containing protein n=1 Tax=Marinagarivorans algicola TaxID=1513270 RepID=UPI0037362006